MTDTAIKVLLVEDNPVDARVAIELLGKHGGFEPTLVERLSEAVTRLGEHHFDVVLLDLMLPDSSGLATIDSVVEHAPGVPIVVYSGSGASGVGTEEDVLFAREAIRAGAQDFLPKSLATPVVLQRAILASIERKHQEQRRVRYARHDELTGLPNHSLLEERFERAAARADRQERHLALLSIELDHYLNVVERMGDAFADRLLCAAAERLQANFRRSDTLARLRPHGFTALLEGLARPNDAGALAGKLRSVMVPAFRFADHDVFLTASVGIALYPRHGRRLPELVRAAEGAMFEVVMAGGNGCLVAELPAATGTSAEAAADLAAGAAS